MSTRYYILSLKHSPGDALALWWGPNNCGYTANINDAGLYDESVVGRNPEYYNNKTTTLAVAEWELLGKTKEVVTWSTAMRLDDFPKPAQNT